MFSAEPKTPRPGGEATGYDCDQRACGPSDTSRGRVLYADQAVYAAWSFCLLIKKKYGRITYQSEKEAIAMRRDCLKMCSRRRHEK